MTAPQFAQHPVKLKGAQGKGIRYEEQVVKKFERELDEGGWVGIPGPWFWFIDHLNRERYAQPDWLGFCPREGKIVIAEMKLTRVYRAWWQLNQLYYPLVKYMFPNWDIAMVEIATKVKHFALPTEVKVVQQIEVAPIQATSFMQVNYNAG